MDLQKRIKPGLSFAYFQLKYTYLSNVNVKEKIITLNISLFSAYIVARVIMGFL